MIADIETMLNQSGGLPKSCRSERSRVSRPSFEVMNIMAWPPRMNNVTNIKGTLPRVIASRAES